MNHLGWLAEELTQMEEGLDDPRYAPYARSLRRALQRAFIEACKASRAMRQAQEQKTVEKKPMLRAPQKAGARKPGRAAGLSPSRA